MTAGLGVLPYLAIWTVVASTNFVAQLHRLSGARALFVYLIAALLSFGTLGLLLLGISAALGR